MSWGDTSPNFFGYNAVVFWGLVVRCVGRMLSFQAFALYGGHYRVTDAYP